MEKVILEAQLREEKGKSKVKSLRQEGFIPAVVYGVNRDSQSIKLSRHDFLRFIHQHRFESTIVDLEIKGQKTCPVLVKDVQYHPIKEEIIHIDFLEISLTSEIKVNVEIVVKGEPMGVKQESGVLNRLLWELEIVCLPTQIPKGIEVDVSGLKVGDVIHVRDLSLPPGVKVLNVPDTLVFSVDLPVKEEEIAAPATEGKVLVEPEVIKEKKETLQEEKKEESEK